ncbi:neurosecretory protein VGF [Periophthalmus magnuspinnatus]|uniref:neurosecretory protein VGF n=1 Tax=Periophthalmus magnuspinnatus TaxID=409849 RepID=UPI00145A583C|nr:neurosecretory protein VGF [Periophthalmus magnuspinnatus]XP_055082487.1 neurosecretory protein VGF [Periophthalmus magnuspinnatus]
MVMTCHHGSSPARLVLLVLLTVVPQLAGAAPVRGEGLEGGVEDSQEHTLSPPISLINTSQDQGEHPGSDKVTDEVLAALLEALDHPSDGDSVRERDWREAGGRELPSPDASEAGEIRGPEASPREPRAELPEREGGGADKTEQLIVGPLTAAQGEDFKQKKEEEDQGWSKQDVGDNVSQGQEQNQESFNSQGENDPLLQRKIRGYFQNIDLGLQDNEILPPLKGYKAYNTQLARAGKKLHWEDNRDRNRPAKGGNFMDDFEEEGEELEEVEEEEESLSRMEEEARAQAEKQEVLRQQEEAERAREEEQRLADIASDMLLQYMGRKQQSYMKPRQKSSMGNAAEDKRSEEIVQDEDDMDQQMIDRLIEISSKLHLPADDVIEIISDVEEKKKKRKELQQQPVNNNPVTPRFRPLVPPPLAAPPIYHYTASKNPKKQKYNKSNKKWHKDKVKSYKQDYWYKPQKQIDYWYKPQKQFLAFPSYPYYQKPYRAYYPVYFPYPKSQYYGKPPPPRDQLFGPQELDLQPPRRKNWAGGKNRGPGWRQQPAPRLPITPYISNYILPHPRTYQTLPAPKPISQPRRGRRPPYYQPVATGDDYEEDGLVPQLDSEEELENFIERIYMKRRMY